jgi:hypothetical protein
VTARNAITLIHLAGFLTGITLYAMLGAMAGLRSAVRRGERDHVLLLVATLGLIWNAGALVTYGATDFGIGAAPAWLIAAAFSALGFLPAAVIQMTVVPASRRRSLVTTGYALSVVASVLHAISAIQGSAPSPTALWLLSAGFPLLLLWMIISGEARTAGARAITAAALAAFATTALHLSHHSPEVEESVVAAVLGHQGSLPLVLTILYQDYRFALADLFLKRAVSLILLVAIAALAYLNLVAPARSRAMGRHRADVPGAARRSGPRGGSRAAQAAGLCAAAARHGEPSAHRGLRALGRRHPVQCAPNRPRRGLCGMARGFY